MVNYSAFKSLEVTVENQVATLRIVPYGAAVESRDRHWELGEIFSVLRGDNEVRVVVLTGRDEHFRTPPSRSTPGSTKHYTDPKSAWQIFTGIVRCHETMALMEKPIVAKVNGDAIGFNYAVDADQLDARVDEMVAGLLRRPAYSLTWTKRLANKALVAHMHSVLDAAAAFDGGFLPSLKDGRRKYPLVGVRPYLVARGIENRNESFLFYKHQNDWNHSWDD
jgi:enoyl-CoA hydratase/carnithine racemase